ncbi:MAG: hypothetical protein GX549_08515, partial [Clostridiales bacterium]|nr:hypothetical protein [Clostridiales bacterium]
DDDDDDDDNDNPKTGGNGMPWIALLLFGLTGAGALATGRAMKAGRARR